MLYANFDKSSDLKNDLEEKQESPMNLNDLTTHHVHTDNIAPNGMINNQIEKHPSPISPLNEKTNEFDSTANEKLNEIFALTKQKLQPTLDALQDKKDELLLASKHSPNSSIENEYPKKSILRSTQSKLNADVLLAAVKQQQEPRYKIKQSPEIERIKNAINYGIDSGIKPKSSEVSPTTIDDKSISAIKRSYSSLPLSTPAVRNSNSHIFLHR